MTDHTLQSAKKLVRSFNASFDATKDDALAEILAAWTTTDYSWRGVHPFHEREGTDAVVDSFWAPLRHSFSSMQRQEDIFFSGKNVIDRAGLERNARLLESVLEDFHVRGDIVELRCR